jgi:hypothetical protein
MIILLAMINSLAARENALQGATAPPNRAAWGVYAGDGKTRELDGKRRNLERFRCHRIAAKGPRRPSSGSRGVDSPLEHRQPETKRD